MFTVSSIQLYGYSEVNFIICILFAILPNVNNVKKYHFLRISTMHMIAKSIRYF